MYQISEYSGKIKNTETGEVFEQNDALPQWEGFSLWRQDNALVFIDFFDGEENQYNRKNLPQVVSRRQLKLQLALNGISQESILTVINSLPEFDRTIAEISWYESITFELDNPLLRNLGYALGMTDEDVDNIFLNASQL